MTRLNQDKAAREGAAEGSFSKPRPRRSIVPAFRQDLEPRVYRRRWLGELVRMRAELQRVVKTYRDAIEASENGWLLERYEARLAHLQKGISALDQVIEAVALIPRLK